MIAEMMVYLSIWLWQYILYLFVGVSAWHLIHCRVKYRASGGDSSFAQAALLVVRRWLGGLGPYLGQRG